MEKQKWGIYPRQTRFLPQNPALDPVLAFFYELPQPAQQKLGLQLHHFILSYPNMHCRLRYKIPFYDRKTWVCYLNPIQDQGFEWVFLKAQQMEDPQKWLDARGRKMVKGMMLHVHTPPPFEQLDQLMQAALWCDDQTTTPKRKKQARS